MAAIAASPDPDALFPAKDAALAFHTSVAVICMWRNRGHLPVAKRDAKGRPLYRWQDLKDAEKATRQTRERGIRPGARRQQRPPWPNCTDEALSA